MPAYSRKFEKFHDDANPHILRILQWNILAQALNSSDKFFLCDVQDLSPDVRLEKIVNEISDYKPDIVCLEEADIHTSIENRLSCLYSSIFSPKINSPCLYYEENFGADGTVIFFRNDKFSLERHQICKTSDDNLRSVLMLILRHIETNSIVIVFGIHLKAKQDCAQTRAKEVKYILGYLKEALNSHPGAHVFVLGDFNAEYKEEAIEMMKSSNYGLASAYAMANGQKEPEFTTWKKIKHECGRVEEIKRTIDYIFFSSNNLRLSGIFLLPSVVEIGISALPNKVFPSDHLNLIAEFNLVIS